MEVMDYTQKSQLKYIKYSSGCMFSCDVALYVFFVYILIKTILKAWMLAFVDLHDFAFAI